MRRRDVLTASVAFTLPRFAPSAMAYPGRLGIASTSYSQRWRGRYSNIRFPPFRDALDFIDYARSLHIGSVQIPVRGWTEEFAGRVRATCAAYGLNLEGMIELPKTEGDTARFERELRVAKGAGAAVFRTALGGRRYEQFHDREAFESWHRQALAAMALAEPIARRLDVRIGIENHKDLTIDELLAALNHIASPHVGACIDTGNSIALLEDPVDVVNRLAPFAVTVHLKDMAMHETPEGFQLSEVPLGRGCLPLADMISVIRAGNPRAVFHLEMITRDPLEIPCLRDSYWATFRDKSGRDLARALSFVRAHAEEKLPHTSSLAIEAALALEETNVTASLTYAGDNLGFDHPPK